MSVIAKTQKSFSLKVVTAIGGNGFVTDLEGAKAARQTTHRLFCSPV